MKYKNENKSIIKVHIKVLSHIHARTEAIRNLYTKKTEKKETNIKLTEYIFPRTGASVCCGY